MTRTAVASTILSLTLFLLQGGAAFANAPILVTTIPGSEGLAEKVCENRTDCTVLKSDSKKFDNGNTFVRFREDVTGRTFVIALPVGMNGDQLMDALIRVRTAQSLGARHISVVTRNRVDQELESMLVTAGATDMLPFWGKVAPAAKGPGSGKSFIINETHGQLAEELSRRTGIPLVSDESKVSLVGEKVFLVAPAVEPVNENFFRILSRIRALTWKGAKVHLITPYLPYARSDKVDQPGITITCRLAADLIEAAGAKAVLFVRAHAPQTQGFFRIPAFNIAGRHPINEVLRELKVQMIVSPDAGFQKDATLYASDLGLPVAVINKQRDPESGELKNYGIGGPSVAGSRVAIVDDETASGGTLESGAGYLKSLGAESVVGVVTHLAGNAGKALRSPHLEQLIATDTLPVRVPMGPRFRVVSIASELADIVGKLAAEHPAPGCGFYLGDGNSK